MICKPVLLPSLLVVFATFNCAPEAPDVHTSGHAIINGQACDTETQPSAVALLIDGQVEMPIPGFPPMPIRTILCTGTLIAPDVVLTAAHCVDPSVLLGGMGTFKEATYYVSFEADLTKLVMNPQTMGGALPELPADAVKAAARVGHPSFTAASLQQFTGGLANLYDVALVFLEKAVDVEPAVVITRQEAEQLVEQAEVEIAGWGQQTAAPQDPFNPPPPGTVGQKICGTTKINAIGEHEMQIGSDAASQRKCHGDSGGPSYLVVETEHAREQRVVGITSHAFDQTDCQKGGVDTRVDVWLDWIEEQMKKGCTDGTRSWCDEETGIISPEYYDPPPPPPDIGVPDAAVQDAGPDGTGGDGEVTSKSSGCSVTGTPPSGVLLLLLVALLRRGTGSTHSTRLN